MMSLFFIVCLIFIHFSYCEDCICITDDIIRCGPYASIYSIQALPCALSASWLLSSSMYLCQSDIHILTPQIIKVNVTDGGACECLCDDPFILLHGCSRCRQTPPPPPPSTPPQPSSTSKLGLGFGIAIPILLVGLGLAIWKRKLIMRRLHPGHVVGHGDIEMRLANLERPQADVNVQLNRANVEQFQEQMDQLAQLEVHSRNTLAACSDFLTRLEPNFQPINRDVQIGFLDPTWQLCEDNLTRFLRGNFDKPTLRSICETSGLEFLDKSWNELASNISRFIVHDMRNHFRA